MTGKVDTAGWSINQAEQWFIGQILQTPDRLMDCNVSEKHFLTSNHRLIFSTIRRMEDESKTIDAITVADELEQQTRRGGWLALLGQYQMDSFSPTFFDTAQTVILDHYRKRQIAHIAQELQKDYDADKAILRLMEIDEPTKRYSYTLAESALAAVEHAQESAKRDGVVGLPTGLKLLDDAIGGFQPSDLYVFGARPAMGKTSVILNFMLNHGDAPTAFFSTEQPHEQIGLRAIAATGSVNARKIRLADFDQHEFDRMAQAVTALTRSRVIVYDKGHLTLAELMSEARRLKFNNDIQAVYVDYIQRIKTDQKERRLEVAEVVTGLKSLARELNIPVIALAQVNRTVEQRADKRPRMGDLLESGVIEQEADVVALLYRDEVYNQDTADKGIIEVLIDKNRHGPVGTLKFAWLGETMQIKDLYQGGEF